MTGGTVVRAWPWDFLLSRTWIFQKSNFRLYKLLICYEVEQLFFHRRQHYQCSLWTKLTLTLLHGNFFQILWMIQVLNSNTLYVLSETYVQHYERIVFISFKRVDFLSKKNCCICWHIFSTFFGYKFPVAQFCLTYVSHWNMCSQITTNLFVYIFHLNTLFLSDFFFLPGETKPC